MAENTYNPYPFIPAVQTSSLDSYDGWFSSQSPAQQRLNLNTGSLLGNITGLQQNSLGRSLDMRSLSGQLSDPPPKTGQTHHGVQQIPRRETAQLPAPATIYNPFTPEIPHSTLGATPHRNPQSSEPMDSRQTPDHFQETMDLIQNLRDLIIQDTKIPKDITQNTQTLEDRKNSRPRDTELCLPIEDPTEPFANYQNNLTQGVSEASDAMGFQLAVDGSKNKVESFRSLPASQLPIIQQGPVQQLPRQYMTIKLPPIQQVPRQYMTIKLPPKTINNGQLPYSEPQGFPNNYHYQGDLRYLSTPTTDAQTYNPFTAMPSFSTPAPNPAFGQPTNLFLPSYSFAPRMPIVPITPYNQPGLQTLGFCLYGDCAESLPLAVMTNHQDLSRSVLVRSVAIFTSKLRGIESIPEDGPIKVPTRLRGPCLNCKSLMRRLPGRVKILAASGSSQNICWEVGNHSTHNPQAGWLGFPSRNIYIPSRSSDFPLSAAHRATKYEIYAILKVCALSNTNPFIFSAEIRMHLANLWYEFIIPYRDNGAIFRLDQDGNVQPLMLTINGVTIPICTVFCAMGYILSTVLWPDRVVAQRESSYLPLMAILAKWCYTLCPWGHPNVISVVYLTNDVPGVDTLFLLGTSKPMVHEGGNPTSVQPKHAKQMRSFRTALLEDRFGLLENPCPEKVAAECRKLLRA